MEAGSFWSSVANKDGSIDDILGRNDFTLTDVLEHSAVMQELKLGSTRLLDYLCKAHVLTEMISMMVNPYPRQGYSHQPPILSFPDGTPASAAAIDHLTREHAARVAAAAEAEAAAAAATPEGTPSPDARAIGSLALTQTHGSNGDNCRSTSPPPTSPPPSPAHEHSLTGGGKGDAAAGAGASKGNGRDGDGYSASHLPHSAAELLSLVPERVTNVILSEPSLMKMLFSTFVDSPAGLDPGCVVYIRRVIIALIQRKQAAVVSFIRRNKVLPHLVRHLSLDCALEILVMTGWDCGAGTSVEPDWMVEEGLVQLLLSEMDSESATVSTGSSNQLSVDDSQQQQRISQGHDLIYNITRLLTDVLLKRPDCSLSAEIISPSCACALLDRILDPLPSLARAAAAIPGSPPPALASALGVLVPFVQLAVTALARGLDDEDFEGDEYLDGGAHAAAVAATAAAACVSGEAFLKHLASKMSILRDLLTICPKGALPPASDSASTGTTPSLLVRSFDTHSTMSSNSGSVNGGSSPTPSQRARFLEPPLQVVHRRPLGALRLSVVELTSLVIRVPEEIGSVAKVLHDACIDNHIPRILIELVAQYPWNSLLHAFIESALVSLFSETPDCDILFWLVKVGGLVPRLVACYDANTAHRKTLREAHDDGAGIPDPATALFATLAHVGSDHDDDAEADLRSAPATAAGQLGAWSGFRLGYLPTIVAVSRAAIRAADFAPLLGPVLKGSPGWSLLLESFETETAIPPLAVVYEALHDAAKELHANQKDKQEDDDNDDFFNDGYFYGNTAPSSTVPSYSGAGRGGNRPGIGDSSSDDDNEGGFEFESGPEHGMGVADIPTSFLKTATNKSSRSRNGGRSGLSSDDDDAADDDDDSDSCSSDGDGGLFRGARSLFSTGRKTTAATTTSSVGSSNSSSSSKGRK